MAPNIFYSYTGNRRPSSATRPQSNADVNTLVNGLSKFCCERKFILNCFSFFLLLQVSNAARAYVTLRRSTHPDLIYEHLPEKNQKEVVYLVLHRATLSRLLLLLQFVFQIVTLASVWLGVSIFRCIWKPSMSIKRSCIATKPSLMKCGLTVWFFGRCLTRCFCFGNMKI